MALIVVLIVVGLVVAWGVSAYNGLISLKNQVANAWKQIDVQLKRRHDLIPNLVESVKGAMQFERGTLEAVTSARTRAMAVQSAGTTPNVAATAAAESQLSGALGRLMAVVEAYPDLKSMGNAAQLQEELTSTENKIAFARQMYNDTATMYNTRQRQFPAVLVAGMVGAAPAELWEITDSAERENVHVDLSISPPSAPAPAAPSPAPTSPPSTPTSART
jgi:LemA protein